MMMQQERDIFFDIFPKLFHANFNLFSDMVNNFGMQIDDETRDIINQVTPGTRGPLQFHCIHGSNVVILKSELYKVGRKLQNFDFF